MDNDGIFDVNTKIKLAIAMSVINNIIINTAAKLLLLLLFIMIRSC